MKAFTNVFVAHFKQFVRDKGALFFTFFFPVMFILIFGLVFDQSGLQSFKIGVVDEGSPVSADTISGALDAIIIDEEKVFEEIEQGDLDTELESLRQGDIDAVIVIPANMDSQLVVNQPVDLKLYYDPSQTSNQQILVPILTQVLDEIDRNLQGSTQLISLEENNIQSRNLRYIDYLVPGILGMSLMFTGIFGGLPLIQQRQARIIKRLGCTPLRRSMLVFGDLAFRVLIVLVTAAIIILVARLVFDVQMIGNWFSLFGIVLLGTLVFSCLGYLVAAFVKTEEGAIPIINVITFPMMFLSGTFFDVTNMPSFIEPVVKVLPLTYLGDALRQIMVDGSPLYPITTDIAVMAGWIVVSLAITIPFFRWD